jgi:hypothetical protein
MMKKDLDHDGQGNSETMWAEDIQPDVGYA